MISQCNNIVEGFIGRAIIFARVAWGAFREILVESGVHALRN